MRKITTVLVTGGFGFIGSQVVRALVSRGDKVIIYGRTTNPRRIEDVKEKVTIEGGDLLDLAYLMATIKAHDVDKIVHTVAIGWRKGQGKQPYHTLRVNVEGSANIYEAARLFDVKRVVGFSSYWVYGKTQYEPIDEDHPCNPREGVYNVSKLMAERWGLMYHDLYGLDFISVRPTSVYGPYQPLGDEPLQTLLNAMEGRPTKLPKGADHRFDPVCVFDVVDGTLRALDVSKDKLEHRVFNLGLGKAYTLAEVVEKIKKIIPDADIEVGPGLVEGWDCATGLISIRRAREELGYEPRYDILEGFKLCVEHAARKCE